MALQSLPQTDAAPELGAPKPGDPIALFRTSGTTGTPKAFHLSCANIGWNVQAMAQSGWLSSADRVLMPLPMHHVYPWITAVLSCVTVGATLILPEGPTGPEIAEALAVGRPTFIVGVPKLYDAMLAGIRSRAGAAVPLGAKVLDALLDLAIWLRQRTSGRFGHQIMAPFRRAVAPDLRMLISGGAHLSVETETALEALGWDVRGGYGLAETASSICGPIRAKRPGSVGQPIAGCEVRIDTPGADGTGEILLRGPVVFSGYIDNPEANARAFTADGFFRTGDLGRLDPDGFLYDTGRLKEVIVLAGGDKLYPEDVESRYLADPVIAEIGVLEWGGALVAVIVPSLAEIAKRKLINPREAVALAVATIAKDLPSTWRLSGFVLTHEPLPRTRLMKLRRFLLPDLYAERQSGRSVDHQPRIPTAEDAVWISGEPRVLVWDLLKAQFPDRAFSLDGYVSYDFGLDSFGWMNLSLAIEAATGVRLSAADIARITTVRDLLRIVSEHHALLEADRDEDAEIAAAATHWLSPRTVFERLLGVLLQLMNAMLMRIVFRLRVEGREHLAAFGHGKVLICPNHASDIDALAVAAALPARLRSRARWSGSRGAAFGTRLRRALARPVGMFPVDQAAPMVAVGLAVDSLRRGLVQVWFPEGLLTPDGRLLPFHEGVGYVIERSGAPVVPAVIDGSYAAYPRDRRFPRALPIRVIFGRPIAAEKLVHDLPEGAGRARAVAQRLQHCAHHGDPATDSMNIRPPIPRRSGHRFHAHPATLV